MNTPTQSEEIARLREALQNAANGYALLAANLRRQSDDVKFGAWFKSAASMADDGAKQINAALSL